MFKVLSKFVSDNKNTIMIFVVTFIIAYFMGLTIIRVVDNRMKDISINMPKISLPEQHITISLNGDKLCTTKDTNSHGTDIVIPKFKIPSTSTSASSDVESFENVNASSKGVRVGCAKDSDCNLVHGQGHNICKSDNTCHCVSGSGTFCHLSSTNYKDPRDMSTIERKIFKKKFRTDMTFQDYKNWLLLYKNETHKLRRHHRINLIKLLNGVVITENDIPDIQVLPPLDPSEYFKKMYNGGKISIQFPESDQTGGLLEYNYSDYGDFIPPQHLETAWITGEVDLFSRKVNPRELNHYVRPFVTTGEERSAIGREYVYNRDKEKCSGVTNCDLPIPKFDDLGNKFEAKQIETVRNKSPCK